MSVRPIKQVLRTKATVEGAGVKLQRAFGFGNTSEFDPFLLLVLPRACALAIACFTLGVMFVLAALLSGFVAGSLLEAVRISIWSFLDRVLLAMHARDFVVFPAKMIVIGWLIALTASLTGLTATAQDEAARLLPRAFVRGVVAVLLANLARSRSGRSRRDRSASTGPACPLPQRAGGCHLPHLRLQLGARLPGDDRRPAAEHPGRGPPVRGRSASSARAAACER